MELEEALGDRLSFIKRFVGLALEETVQDYSTLCRFRNLLIGENLLEKLFGELDRQLDAAGLILPWHHAGCDDYRDDGSASP